MDGFKALNDSCVVLHIEVFNVIFFLLCVAEVLLCAIAVRWWRTQKGQYAMIHTQDYISDDDSKEWQKQPQNPLTELNSIN